MPVSTGRPRRDSMSAAARVGFAALLTLAAVIGKQACALGVLRGNRDRLSIGLGMIPRGEVGLIFASIGLGLKTVSGAFAYLRRQEHPEGSGDKPDWKSVNHKQLIRETKISYGAVQPLARLRF